MQPLRKKPLLARASVLASIMTLGGVTACSDDGDDGRADGSGGAPGSGGGSGAGGTGQGGSGTGGSGTGGSGTGGAAPEAGSTTFSLKLRGVVGSEAFDCETMYMGLGTTGQRMMPNDFRFYVHDVRLIGAGGETPLLLESDGKWQTDEVALVDFENNAGTCDNGTTDTNDTVTGTAKEGTYTGVVFKIGVPEALNHQNPAGAPSPLNLTAMAWDWTYGYKFMKVDFGVHRPMPEGGMPMGDGGMPVGDAGHADAGQGGSHGHGGGSVFFHIGSGLCTGNPAEGGAVSCERPNRPEIRLDTFDMATQAVVVDYAALVAGINAAMDMGGAPGCMSGAMDPECAPMFDAVGVDLATGEAKAGQTVFKAGPQ